MITKKQLEAAEQRERKRENEREAHHVHVAQERADLNVGRACANHACDTVKRCCSEQQPMQTKMIIEREFRRTGTFLLLAAAAAARALHFRVAVRVLRSLQPRQRKLAL